MKCPTPGSAEDPTEGTGDAVPQVPEVAGLLAEAQILFQEAEQALSDGDLGTYQSKVKEAEDLIVQALQLDRLGLGHPDDPARAHGRGVSPPPPGNVRRRRDVVTHTR